MKRSFFVASSLLLLAACGRSEPLAGVGALNPSVSPAQDPPPPVAWSPPPVVAPPPPTVQPPAPVPPQTLVSPTPKPVERWTPPPRASDPRPQDEAYWRRQPPGAYSRALWGELGDSLGREFRRQMGPWGR